MRDEIIADINNAYYAGAYLSALTLALAIPDVRRWVESITKKWYNKYKFNDKYMEG